MRMILTILIIAILLPACKSGRRMTPAPQTPRPAPERVAEPPVEEPQAEIPVLEESFEFERKEDEVKHQVNRYFVIIGSFRISENAARYRNSIETKGFSPVILRSETGLHRISVGSFANEAAARQQVMEIRRSWPEHNDTWLLIRKDL